MGEGRGDPPPIRKPLACQAAFASTPENIVDFSKLNSLSTDTLRAMNSHIVGLIRQRQAMEQMQAGSKLRIGGKAMFTHSRTGARHAIVIDKINTKTVVGRELNPDGTTRMTWKVSPTLLTLVDDRPKTTGAGVGASW